MLKSTGKKLVLIASIFFLSLPVFANDVEIIKVVLTKRAGTWQADVTLKHQDEGWKHYADGWRLVDADGKEIAMRTLYHPHVNEQPFTRSESGFHIMKDVKVIYVEAHDLKHGWSADKVKIDLSKPSGDRYEIRNQ